MLLEGVGSEAAAEFGSRVTTLSGSTLRLPRPHREPVRAKRRFARSEKSHTGKLAGGVSMDEQELRELSCDQGKQMAA